MNLLRLIIGALGIFVWGALCSRANAQSSPADNLASRSDALPKRSGCFISWVGAGTEVISIKVTTPRTLTRLRSH